MFLGGIEEEHQPKTGPSKPAITCSKLTIDTLELGVKHVQYVWIYFTPCSCVSIVNFEQINAGWDYTTSMASYIFHKPNKMTRKEINLNILMFTLLSVLFTKSLVSLAETIFCKNRHRYSHVFGDFPKFWKELLKQSRGLETWVIVGDIFKTMSKCSNSFGVNNNVGKEEGIVKQLR